jgi:hypothetical protein
MTFDAAKKSELVRERLTFQMLHFVHLGLRNTLKCILPIHWKFWNVAVIILYQVKLIVRQTWCRSFSSVEFILPLLIMTMMVYKCQKTPGASHFFAMVRIRVRVSFR